MKLVVFTQNGCRPCAMVKNFLQGNDVEFETVNVSENPEAIEEHGIMSTPVTILFDEDEEIGRVVGFNPEDLEVLAEQL